MIPVCFILITFALHSPWSYIHIYYVPGGVGCSRVLSPITSILCGSSSISPEPFIFPNPVVVLHLRSIIAQQEIFWPLSRIISHPSVLIFHFIDFAPLGNILLTLHQHPINFSTQSSNTYLMLCIVKITHTILLFFCRVVVS